MTNRSAALSLLCGATMLLAGTLLHPMGADPNDPLAAFAEYAADDHWLWSHLGQFVGVLLLALGMVGFAATLDTTASRSWGRIGTVCACALIAVAAALQAVDGIALKRVVDHWAAAPPSSKPMAFEAAFAVRQIETGLAGFLSLLTGVTTLAYSQSILSGRRFPRWFGWVGHLIGLGFMLSGVVQGATGFSGLAMALSMTASIAFLFWIAWLAITLWRSGATAAQSAVDPG
jgi:hypothetical protein